ncbi:MAG: hypothetical protein EPN14_02505 [Gallionella sp.]|nr:MAG: hypothetical protein EPN14_02505 [Gallionella sp.]
MNNLPSAMKLAKRWLVWKSIPNPDPTKKPRKVPYYITGIPRNGALDTPEDVVQLGTFDEAMRAMDTGRYAGLGFALGADEIGNCWQGIDLDGMSKRPELQAIAASLKGVAYCETSPSGDGIHAIGYGRKFDAIGSTSDGIEAYSGGRYFTVTGNSLNSLHPFDLHDFVESELRPKRRVPVINTQAAGVAVEAVTAEQVADLRSALLFMRADDRDIWQRNGHRLKTLGDVGRGLFLEWSATSEKFEPLDAANTWESFKPARTSYQAIFTEAQKLGWVNPRARALPNLASVVFGAQVFEAPTLSAADVRDGTASTRPLTELGNAQRLKDIYSDVLRYVPEIKAWMEWNQGGWIWHSSGDSVRELASVLPRMIYKDGNCFVDFKQAEHFAKWARTTSSARTIEASLSLLSSMSGMRLSLPHIDADPMLIGFDHARQVIDLRTGIARAATPDDFITKSLAPCSIGDAALAVRWLAFLEQVFDGDAQLIGWLHRWCGYLLTGKTSEQIFLFFFGLGANGKSVFAETIRHVAGDYARTVASETLTATKRQAGGASPDLADLIGCRLALSTETEDGSALAESLIKTITGGDAISTRKLYCEPVTFQPAFKLLMLGNHRPIIHGADHGIWRRIRLVPFTRTFSEQERDPHLLETLKAEAPHILAWMVSGCIAWQRRGLADVPAVVATQTAEYRAEQDIVGQWLGDCTTADRASEADAGSLYDNYRLWAMNAGLKPASKVSLGRRLSERGFAQRKKHGRRMWCGIALKNHFGASLS